MRKILWAAGGIVALGLLGAPVPASAGTLGSAAPLLAAPMQAQVQPENVYWVRRCRPVRRWWGGRWHWTRKCNNVWVRPGPRRGWGPPPPPPRW